MEYTNHKRTTWRETFLWIDFSTEQTSDTTKLLHFQHLQEKHDIARKMFDDVKQDLDEFGLIMHGGTIVNATIIHTPSSTKNRPMPLRCTPPRRGISGTSA